MGAHSDLSAANRPCPQTEDELVQLLIELLPSLGEISVWEREVRSHGRSRTDVCLVIEDVTWGIEAKLADWKRAVSQAALNRCSVQRSFVALWHERVNAEVTETAKRFGLGLLSISSTAIEIQVNSVEHFPDPVVLDRVRAQLVEVSK